MARKMTGGASGKGRVSSGEALDRAFVASLPLDVRAEFAKRNDGAGLLRVTFHLVLIVMTSSLILDSAPLLPLWIVLQGVFLIALFAPLHETIHRTAFRTPALNTGVAFVAGFILFLLPGWFRHFHLAHHAFTQDPERDPELASPKPQTLSQYLWHLTGARIWYQQARALLRAAIGREREPFIPAAKMNSLRLEARVFLSLYGVLALVSFVLRDATLLWLWIVPILLGQPFLRAYLMAEHTGCPFVGDMIRNTRTTLSNPVVRFLAWNMPYHTEHHIYPTVPFHHLPKLHRLLSPHLVNREHGYFRFHYRMITNFLR